MTFNNPEIAGLGDDWLHGWQLNAYRAADRLGLIHLLVCCKIRVCRPSWGIIPNRNPFSCSNLLISLGQRFTSPDQILIDESTLADWLDPAIVRHPNFDQYRCFNDLRRSFRLGGTIWNFESGVRIYAISVDKKIRINVSNMG